MKCQVCGIGTQYTDLCEDCKRFQRLREHADFRASMHEDFQRKLAHEQISNQRKLLKEQAEELDFREANRLLLELEMQAVDDLAAAKKKTKLFFRSSLYYTNATRLKLKICESSFLLELFAEHELDYLNRHPESDGDLDQDLNDKSRYEYRLYAKILELVEAESISNRLRPELVKAIKLHDAQRRAEAQRQEDEQRRIQEELDKLVKQVLDYAAAPPLEIKRPILPDKPQPWYSFLFPVTPAQKAAQRELEKSETQRDNLIGELTRATHQAIREYSQHPDNHSLDVTRYVLTEMLSDDRFDQRLVIHVVSNLVRNGWIVSNQWLESRQAVIQAVDAFEQDS